MLIYVTAEPLEKYSGRSIQIRTIINEIDSDLDIKVMSFNDILNTRLLPSNLIKSLLRGFVISFNIYKLLYLKRHESSTIIVAGVRSFSLWFPLIKLLNKNITLSYQSTNQGYDDPETITNSHLRLLYCYCDYHFSQLPSRVKGYRGFFAHCRVVFFPNIVPTETLRTMPGNVENIAIYSAAVCERKQQVETIKFLIGGDISVDFYGPIKGFYEYDKSYSNAFINLLKTEGNFNYKGVYSHQNRNLVVSKYKNFVVSAMSEGVSNSYLECISIGLTPIFVPNADMSLFSYLDSLDVKNNSFFTLDLLERKSIMLKIFHNKPLGMLKDLVQKGKL
jgi:hypothetical protein